MADPRPTPYTTELEGLRAPLGVILYLIRRDNLDIYDIPIAKITREYLDYLGKMEEMQIELAGEFFVLAATLMRIKAQMLLRTDDGEEDPREELVRSLLEYKKMVEAAKSFRDMEEHRANIFTRPVHPEEQEMAGEPVIDLSLFQLMRAFQEVMNQFEGAEVREIELEQFTIEEKIDVVRTALTARQPIMFTDLFANTRTRLELIVTFMAMLELLKHGQARVEQENSFGAIWIYQGANFGKPMDAVSDWTGDPTLPVEMTEPGAFPALAPELDETADAADAALDIMAPRQKSPPDAGTDE